MNTSRKQVWRVLELAAKIAQEDERAATTLFRAASSMVPAMVGQASWDKVDLAVDLQAIANTLDRVLGVETLQRAIDEANALSAIAGERTYAGPDSEEDDSA